MLPKAIFGVRLVKKGSAKLCQRGFNEEDLFDLTIILPVGCEDVCYTLKQRLLLSFIV